MYILKGWLQCVYKKKSKKFLYEYVYFTKYLCTMYICTLALSSVLSTCQLPTENNATA